MHNEQQPQLTTRVSPKPDTIYMSNSAMDGKGCHVCAISYKGTTITHFSYQSNDTYTVTVSQTV